MRKLFWLGITVIAISWGVCMFLDVKKYMTHPAFYWCVGVLTGMISMGLLVVDIDG
jgi:hypothetical protein